jgi:hypothetical protein
MGVDDRATARCALVKSHDIGQGKSPDAGFLRNPKSFIGAGQSRNRSTQRQLIYPKAAHQIGAKISVEREKSVRHK